MTKPAASCRRIDQLKAIAFNCGFTNEDARQFGKLSKTATWETLLELYLVDGESLDRGQPSDVSREGAGLWPASRPRVATGISDTWLTKNKQKRVSTNA